MPFPSAESTPAVVTVRRDFLASLVVFLVALPLCMGISIASGVPVTSGLITGVVGGLIVTTISGSPLQVSGPAAGLVVTVLEIVRVHGVASVGLILIVGGGIQLVAGMLRMAQWFRAVSPTVVHAMLTGIGILIVAGQLHVMVDDKPRDSGLKNLLSLPEAFAKGLPLPKWEPREANQHRTTQLRKFGTLHETQIELANAVAAHVSPAALPSGATPPIADQQNMLATQTRLREEVEAAVKELREERFFANDPARAEALLAAAEKSVLLMRAAEGNLKQQAGSESVQSTSEAAVAIQEILGMLKSHDWAAKVGLFTILVILTWTRLSFSGLKTIPATLVAVLAATSAAAAFSLPVNYVEIPERLADGITWPSLTVLQQIPVRALLINGLMIALIASAETLLCASAVDKLHNGPRTKYDQELFAQGVGNMICGVLGGLPMTGVIVRSAANIQAGARSRLSAFLHGAWLLICILFLATWLQMIPTACLAGILVYTGYRLIDFRTLRHLCQTDKSEAGIFLVTVGLIVCEDLLLGVVAGTVLSAVKLLLLFSHLQAELVYDKRNRTARLDLAGAATFLRLPVLASVLEKAPAGIELHVDLKRLNYIDHACLELLTNWSRQHEANGGRMIIDWDQLRLRLHSGNGNGTMPRLGLPPSPTSTTPVGKTEPAHQRAVEVNPGSGLEPELRRG